MIQRKQTLFLLLAAICLGLAAFLAHGTLLMTILLIVAALTALCCIFLYKNRKLQATITLPVLAVLVLWYILLSVYYGWNMLGWADALPLAALLFTFLARKGIIHDEKLVRSLDRIR